MAISTYFHRNVLLLTQVIPTSDEFKLHFHEGMFDKPNTIGFMHVSQYLLTIYDLERFKKLIQWPVTCKKTEVKYRNNVKDYLNQIANENVDIDFPPILTSYLVRAHGTKFTIIMWKLSIVVLRTYIKRNCDPNIFYAPRLGPTKELIKTTLQGINKDKISSITSHHRNINKMKETSKMIMAEEKETLANIKQELFENKQSMLNLISEAPVNSSIKECLANIENTEIIQLWKENITENLSYIRRKQKIFKDVQTLSNKITNMVSSIIGGSEILDAQQLGKVHSSTISLLPLSTSTQYLLHHLYINDKLMLRNFIELLNFLLCQAYQCLKKNELKDISKCLLQIEASQEDIKSGIKSFQNLRTNIESISNNLKSHFYQKKMNETYQENISALENIVFSSSPVITINTNCRDEGNDVLKRLELTPIEGAHKSLFSRYKRQHGNTNLSVSQLRTNLLVSRINFDDTLSLNNSDKISQAHSSIPKTNSLSIKHTGKYSRLFLSYAKKPSERGNCSINSISHSIKANSTTITNTEGEAHNTSQFSLRNTTKSFFDLREVIIPEKFNTINQLKSQYVLKETNNLHNDQCEMDNETEEDNLTNIKDNMSVNIKDITKKRRSISDLVQRYKKVLEITKENIECEN
ncbi:uncharacterized protein LOC122629372 [Vespula pensylvanica]|uniref:HAUS augmin-like complex subunit 6 N-terminal domain-containing protein n=1 Tax=Vespula pensylvanica TaxID=30213 RepID=A0A834UAS3_VESPE|nr:uncharacterized protein LOC122629372 [Vespula pensylvanica]KAF7426995.1 hypothetical protein H0235_006689 [Vespula pensylvanica]